MTEIISIRRRTFLAGSASAMAAAGFAGTGTIARAQDAKPLPDYADWKDPDALIVHSENTLETKRARIGTSGITPNDEVYIRNNLPPPDARP